MSKPIVVITGISGYLGAQTGLCFLQNAEAEGYTVRGTVRDKENQLKVAPLKEAYGALFDQLELVNADLTDEASIIKACEGATYIIHTASPFFLENPKDPQTVIKPAVDGTLSICKAAQQNKVKRVVITSSCYAMCFNGVKG